MNTGDFKDYLRYRRKAPKTVDRYFKTILQIKSDVERSAVEFNEMSYSDVIDYLQSRRTKKVKASTLAKELLVLNHYFEFLIQEEVRYDNPVTGIKIQGANEQRIQKVLTPQELESIYKNFPEKTEAYKRNEVMLSFMVYQGLRTVEIEQLLFSDIDLDECTIFIRSLTKSNWRKIPLQTKQLLPLLNYIENIRPKMLMDSGLTTNHLFFSTGQSDGLKNLFRKLSAQVRKLNEKFESWNQLRASVITDKLASKNARQVQHYFGMKKLKTAEKYQSGSVDDLRSELDRCFEL